MNETVSFDPVEFTTSDSFLPVVLNDTEVLGDNNTIFEETTSPNITLPDLTIPLVETADNESLLFNMTEFTTAANTDVLDLNETATIGILELPTAEVFNDTDISGESLTETSHAPLTNITLPDLTAPLFEEDFNTTEPFLTNNSLNTGEIETTTPILELVTDSSNDTVTDQIPANITNLDETTLPVESDLTDIPTVDLNATNTQFIATTLANNSSDESLKTTTSINLDTLPPIVIPSTLDLNVTTSTTEEVEPSNITDTVTLVPLPPIELTTTETNNDTEIPELPDISITTEETDANITTEDIITYPPPVEITTTELITEEPETTTTTSPVKEVTTLPPPKGEKSEEVPIKVDFKLDGDFDKLVAPDPERAKEEIKSQLAKIMQIDENRITDLTLSKGMRIHFLDGKTIHISAERLDMYFYYFITRKCGSLHDFRTS